MRTTYGWLANFARAAVVVAVALGAATPAAAQFGGLKKKVKQAAGQEGTNQAAEKTGVAPAEAAQTGAPAGGGQVVLTEGVVNQILAGLHAGEAERAAALKEDTPASRYDKARIAYAAAQEECKTAQNDWPRRAMADQKLADRYSAMAEKMANSMSDQKLYAAYADSMMAMMSPSCTVKDPKQPDDYYDSKREIDSRAEKAELKGSGMTRSELYMAKERTDAILRKAPGPDISASEKNAVDKHADELKRLMGYEMPAPTRAAKPAAAAPAPAPAPTPAAPTVSPGQQAMATCMGENSKKHEDEIRALGERGDAAHKRNDTATMMAIADSINRITMAGCNKDQ